MTPSLSLSLIIFAIMVTGLEGPDDDDDDLLAKEHPHLYIWLLKGMVIWPLHWCIDDSLALFVLHYFICSVTPNHQINKPSPSGILKFLFLRKFLCFDRVMNKQLLGDYFLWWLERLNALPLIWNKIRFYGDRIPPLSTRQGRRNTLVEVQQIPYFYST